MSHPLELPGRAVSTVDGAPLAMALTLSHLPTGPGGTIPMARPCKALQGPEQGPEQGPAIPQWIDRGPTKASGFKIWIGDLPPKLNQIQFMNNWLNVDPVIAEALRTGNLTDVHIYPPAGNVSGEQVACLTFDTVEPAMARMQVISQRWRYSDRGCGAVKVKMSVKWVR